MRTRAGIRMWAHADHPTHVLAGALGEVAVGEDRV